MDQKAGEMQTETSSTGKGPTQKRAATQRRRIEAFQRRGYQHCCRVRRGMQV